MTELVYVTRWFDTRGVVAIPVARLRDSPAGPGCKYDPVERAVFWATESFTDPLAAMQDAARRRAERIVQLEKDIADMKKPFGVVESKG